MADYVDIYKIINIVEKEESIEHLQAAYSLAEQKLRALADTARASGGAINSASVQAAAEAYGKLGNQLTTAEADLAKLGGGRGRNSGMALMEFSRAAEDAQYGIAGVLNNIPGLVTALGGGAGLVGVISLAAVGSAQLYKHWGELVNAFGGGIPQPALTGPELLASNLKKASDEMETLQKKSSLTWFEVARLGKLKDEVQATKEAQKNEATVTGILDTPAKAVKEQGDAFKKAVGDVGGQNAFGEIKGNLEEGKDAKGLVFNVVTRTLTKPDQAAKDLLRAASEGDDLARDAIRSSLKSNSPLAAAMDEHTPKDKLMASTGDAEEAALKRLHDRDEQRRKDKKEQDENDDIMDAQYREELAAAKKSKSFLKTPAAKMTEAERDARAEYDKMEVDVATAKRGQTWLGKDEEELTPAEKVAKTQAGLADRARKTRRDEVQGARKQAPGLDEFVRDALLSGESGARNSDLAGVLRGLGLDAKSTDELLVKGQAAGYEKMLKDSGGTSTTISGGQALRDAIQGGVGADIGRQQLDRLTAMQGYLQRIADQRPDITARAT